MSSIKLVATNRKAYHNYNILETYEAGISLVGTEVKSLRQNKVSLDEAYVRPEKGELWLLNAHIARYEASGPFSHEPRRPRRLLMHRNEIISLASQVQEKGLTLVPLKVYFKDDRAKVEIALAKGKKLYDKRETIARRDAEREIDRTLKWRK